MNINWLEDEEIEELNEFLMANGPDNEGFAITDLSSLNWVLRKLSALESRHDADVDLRNEEMRRIERWHEKQESAYQNSKGFLEGLVRGYAKQQRVIDPKAKFRTPYGLVSFRKGKKFNYGDEEKLVKFLNDNSMGEFVKVVETPKKAELKKALTITEDGKAIFTSTGEILPDVTAEEIEDVTIKLEG